MNQLLHNLRFWVLRRLNAVHKPYYDELLDIQIETARLNALSGREQQ